MTKKINKNRNMKKINIMESQEHLLYEEDRDITLKESELYRIIKESVNEINKKIR